MNESIIIHQALSGFFTKDDIYNMYFDDYEKIIDLVKSMREENGRE